MTFFNENSFSNVKYSVRNNIKLINDNKKTIRQLKTIHVGYQNQT